MDVLEIRKISDRNKFEPFCISSEGIFQAVRDQAYKGNSNCLMSIPEEKLNEFTSLLENLGYLVSWEKCFDPHLSSKYSNYTNKFIALDISWF
jgi:hypothetical protein